MAPNARRHRVSVGSDRNQTRSAVGRNAASEAFFVATTERRLRYVLGKSRWKAQRNGDVSVLDLSRLIAKEKQKKYYQAPLIGCEKRSAHLSNGEHGQRHDDQHFHVYGYCER